MTSVLRYPGSKRRLLPILDGYFRPHLKRATSFYDVFVGSASVLMHVARQHPEIRLHANDLDKGIASLWQVIVGSEGDLKALEGLVRAARPTVALREEVKRWDSEDPPERAFQTLLVNRTSYSGIWSAGPLGGRGQKGTTRIDDRWNPGRLMKELRKARALLRGRLRVASIDAVAYLTAMAEEDPERLFYCDPPYIEQGWQLYREILTPRRPRAAGHRAAARASVRLELRPLPRGRASVLLGINQ